MLGRLFLQDARGLSQVGDKIAIFALLVRVVMDPQQPGRMDGDEGGGVVGKMQHASTVRPNRLRAAVAPSATMAIGFTMARSLSSHIQQRSIS